MPATSVRARVNLSRDDPAPVPGEQLPVTPEASETPAPALPAKRPAGGGWILGGLLALVGLYLLSRAQPATAATATTTPGGATGPLAADATEAGMLAASLLAGLGFPTATQPQATPDTVSTGARTTPLAGAATSVATAAAVPAAKAAYTAITQALTPPAGQITEAALQAAAATMAPSTAPIVSAAEAPIAAGQAGYGIGEEALSGIVQAPSTAPPPILGGGTGPEVPLAPPVEAPPVETPVNIVAPEDIQATQAASTLQAPPTPPISSVAQATIDAATAPAISGVLGMEGAQAAITGSGGLVSAAGVPVTAADIAGMTGSELGSAIASGAIQTGAATAPAAGLLGGAPLAALALPIAAIAAPLLAIAMVPGQERAIKVAEQAHVTTINQYFAQGSPQLATLFQDAFDPPTWKAYMAWAIPQGMDNPLNLAMEALAQWAAFRNQLSHQSQDPTTMVADLVAGMQAKYGPASPWDAGLLAGTYEQSLQPADSSGGDGGR